MSAPTVSVVIPAYNAERFVAEAVGSVLAQTWHDLECIVVDDGSTDRTADVVAAIADPRVRCIWKENRKTVSDARNLGIAAARGEFVALLDSDDIWMPDKLEKQLALFRARPELGLVFCTYAITDERLIQQTVIFPDRSQLDFSRWLLLEANGIAPSSTALIRKDVLEAVGSFRLELSVAEDAELAERIARRYPVDAVDDCLAIYRLHGQQGHLRLDAFEHDLLWIYDDRFPEGDEAHRANRRRGLANLYTRLFYYELRGRNVRGSTRHLRRALGLEPVRLVALPAEAIRRRVQRRLRIRGWR